MDDAISELKALGTIQSKIIALDDSIITNTAKIISESKYEPTIVLKLIILFGLYHQKRITNASQLIIELEKCEGKYKNFINSALIKLSRLADKKFKYTYLRFIRCLYKLNGINNERLLILFTSISRKNTCFYDLFGIFMDVLHESESDFYDSVIGDFYTYKIDELYRNKIRNKGDAICEYMYYGYNKQSIEYFIKYDLLEKFQVAVSNNAFDYNGEAKLSPYEEFPLKNLTYIELAAFYGAKDIFKFISIQAVMPPKMLSLSIAGGNLEIVRICYEREQKINLDHFKTSIKYLHNDIFAWLLENKELTCEDEFTLFECTLEYLNFDILTYFIERGFTLNAEYYPVIANYLGEKTEALSGPY